MSITAQPIRRTASFRPLVTVVAILVGLGLCSLGTLQAASALLEMRGAVVSETADTDTPSATAETKAAIALFDGADRWWYAPRSSLSAGMLFMRLAASPDGTQYDHDLLDAAKRRFERGLAETPADAATWAALADARFREGGPSAAAVGALSMSIQLARYEPALLAWRCQLGLAMYASLDTQQRAALASQIRLLGRHSIADLVKLARSSGGIGLIITALGDDNETLIQFQDNLRHAQ
jgi:hypothetical protein